MVLNTTLNKILGILLLVFFSVNAQEDYLESTSAGVQIKVGMVHFRATQNLMGKARELEKLLAFDLEADGRTLVFVSEKVDPLWISRGVQFYIHGQLDYTEKKEVQLQINFSDMYSGVLLVGKIFTVKLEDIRRAGHLFSDEMLQQIYGEMGVSSSKILYVKKGEGKNIALMDYDGHRSRMLTNGNGIKTFPVWGPKAKSFFYTSFEMGYPTIYHQNLGSGSRVLLLKNGKSGFGGHLSPNEKDFVYAGQTGLYTDLVSYDLQTGSEKALTQRGRSELSPFWFPNGEMLAYSSDKGGNPQVYVMDMKYNTDQRVTFIGKYNESPAVSPQGDQIAYCSMDEGKLNIYVLDLKTGSVLQLTANQGDNESPSWSPDGRMLAFSSTRDGKSDIYIMRNNGTGVKKITDSGNNYQPKWSNHLMTKE